jgi:quercetin dioxygenase-like cupin family protein
MSPSWRPDDSFLDLEGSTLKGVKQAQEALKQAGIKGGRRIITSQDAGMEEVVKYLQRARMPKGFTSWQLPIALGSPKSVLGFLTLGAPNAVVPKHAHRGEVFRIVISGSIIVNGKELTAGHWMYVPKDVPYGFKDGALGCIVFHKYAAPAATPSPKTPVGRSARRSASRSTPR